jgi:two-component system copper resistance phosphate regulon response regulator CusR
MNLLIVDDNKEILNFLEFTLRGEGFVVDTAEDGNMALIKAKQNSYDLIVLDMGLPHKTGKEVCRELRAIGKNVPIIMLSVMGEVDDRIELLRAGADDYMTKPFYFPELLARIKAILRRPHQIICEQPLEIDGIEIDMKSRKVFCCGKEVHFTPKEFSLLSYLMKNRGRALSRADILENVWDINADPFTNTVETHIVSLRKKLKCEGKKEIIHTIPSYGYRMD